MNTFFCVLLAGGLCVARLAASDAELVGATKNFEFRSQPWMNVHHFLYAWATQEKSATVPRPHGKPMPDKILPKEMSAEEKSAWEHAVGFYRGKLGSRALVFDDQLIALKRRHWDADYAQKNPATAEQAEIERVIADALPIYLKYWWPQHDRANRAWVASVQPTVERWETKMIPELERIYQGKWPAQRIPVDVTAYTDYYGAYNTGEPHVTVASCLEQNQFPWGVEILFHEASHTVGLETALHAGIGAAAEKTHVKAPRDLWHTIIFATTGELARRQLAAEGRADYVPYAIGHGLYSPGSPWGRYKQLLDRFWLPALDQPPEARAKAYEFMVAENDRLIKAAPPVGLQKVY